ncbi:C40 family peptidase [Christensenella tenuis]|uniref:C40 family peptidase n=1 Tax=Christensenella tenuis TaxID=2763033 RepID=A0ABR7EGW1_9FIRM|nr:NlpC/P60 family protein [Christensenella tenuis]MBC5648974.1 C40 family peptidase [Christensenella tenuis]
MKKLWYGKRLLGSLLVAALLLFPGVALASGAGGGEALSEEAARGLLTDGTTMGEAVANAALGYVGTPYSQALRDQEGYVDCSSFVQRSLRDAGIEIPGYSAAQAEYCIENGYVLGEGEAAVVGDLVFWSKTGCACGRTHEIHHVGIYMGDGKVAEASSSKGQVVVRDLWETTTWEIAFYARPYAAEPDGE